MFQLRNRSDLERDFSETFLRLVRAGAAFDRGDRFEAAGIAAAVYVFVHEGGKRSPSLLSLLGVKKDLMFIDTARPLNPANLLTETPLVLAEVRQAGFEYEALRGNGPISFSPTTFSKWWEAGVIRDAARQIFSRKNLIHFYRHARGGGHSARSFEPQDNVPAAAFKALSINDPAGWIFSRGEENLVPVYGADYASVRQIGWEVEQTLRRQCSELIPNETTLGGMKPLVEKQ